MSLDAALRKLGVEVVWPPRCLVQQITILCGLFFHLSKLFELLLLHHIGELFANQLQLLLVEDVNVLIEVLVEPLMLQHLLGSSSLFWYFLQH